MSRNIIVQSGGIMRQYRRARSQFRLRGFIRTGALIAAGLLVAGLGTMGSASAAASPGYTASFVPAGPGDQQSLAVNPVTDTIYVADSSTNGYELVAIDGSSRAIEATIPLAHPTNPSGIAVNSATNTVYVGQGANLLVIDGATNSLAGTISLPTRTGAVAIAVDSATKMVYVVNDGAVTVINGSTNTIATTLSNVANVTGIAVDEAADVIWVSSIVGNLVVAINGTTDSIIHSVSVSAPHYLAVNPVTDRVYVEPNVLGANLLTVIDGATGTITATVPITIEQEAQIAVDPSADVVFARGVATVNGSAAGGLVVIDGATNTVTDVLGASGMCAAVDTATGTLYETASPSLISPSSGLWAITPSASNAISPLVSGPTGAAGRYGVNVHVVLSASGLPAPAFTETGPLPAGVTLSAGGVLSGTPQTGSAGVYPITITASNGVAPDSSMPFTLTITPGPPPVATSGVVQVKNRATGKCLNENKNTGLLSTYTCMPGTYVSLRWQVVTYSDGTKDLVSVQTGQAVRDNGLNGQLSLTTADLSPMRFQNGGIFRFPDNLVMGVNNQGNYVPVIGSPSTSSLNNVRWDFGSVPA